MDPLFLQLVRVVNLTARPFQQRVGRAHQLTLNEWRVMAALGSHTGSTATEVADLTGLDKMAVSRALTGLSATNVCSATTTRPTSAAAACTSPASAATCSVWSTRKPMPAKPSCLAGWTPTSWRAWAPRSTSWWRL